MVSPHSELVLTTSLWSIMQPQFHMFLTSSAETESAQQQKRLELPVPYTRVLTCAYVAGLDALNNDNFDFGGSQLAADFDNNADQINFKTPGSTTSQFNGEPCKYCSLIVIVRCSRKLAGSWFVQGVSLLSSVFWHSPLIPSNMRTSMVLFADVGCVLQGWMLATMTMWTLVVTRLP